MKTIRSFSFFLLIFVGTIIFTACDKTTSAELLPVLTTSEVTAITQTTATSGGSITADGGSSVTVRGVCWSTKANPTIADNKTSDGGGIGLFISSITGLTAGTTYFVRAYATSSVGTGYGSSYLITTLAATPTVTDADGNIYHSVNIGTQTWLIENLKTTKYKDGTSIPLVTDSTSWAGLTTGAYCWYNNDAVTNKSTYGALYNWYTVNTTKLAPAGWHVATDTEWTTLENFVSANLGSSGSIAKALASTTYWSSYTNIGTIGNDLLKNNSSGFTALPGGFRYSDGTFYFIAKNGYWWNSTETEASSLNAWYRGLSYGDGNLHRYDSSKNRGFSIRCVKDY